LQGVFVGQKLADPGADAGQKVARVLDHCQ
jgi:hypothetical protein